mmetsp:Transcript_21209/g.35003  ORF Transcript_21209/g.35003 Transcript_21209/m.35003 type:complete len:267 (-) Transcript_21209:453-1253(-)
MGGTSLFSVKRRQTALASAAPNAPLIHWSICIIDSFSTKVSGSVSSATFLASARPASSPLNFFAFLGDLAPVPKGSTTTAGNFVTPYVSARSAAATATLTCPKTDSATVSSSAELGDDPDLKTSIQGSLEGSTTVLREALSIDETRLSSEAGVSSALGAAACSVKKVLSACGLISPSYLIGSPAGGRTKIAGKLVTPKASTTSLEVDKTSPMSMRPRIFTESAFSNTEVSAFVVKSNAFGSVPLVLKASTELSPTRTTYEGSFAVT